MSDLRHTTLVPAKMPVSISVVRAIKDKASGVTWHCPRCGRQTFWTDGHPEVHEFCYINCSHCETPESKGYKTTL